MEVPLGQRVDDLIQCPKCRRPVREKAPIPADEVQDSDARSSSLVGGAEGQDQKATGFAQESGT